VYVAGADVGSTTAKVVVLDGAGNVVGTSLGPTGASIVESAQREFREAVRKASIDEHEVEFVVGTGYGRYKIPFGDTQITEISCHARGAVHLFPDTRTIVDIGGQDTKAISVDARGDVVDFSMNDKCAAGTGRFLEAAAITLGLQLDEIGPISLRSEHRLRITNVCTVFVESEIMSHMMKGERVEDILRGVHNAIAGRSLSLLRRVGIDPAVTFTGGVSRNEGMVRALEEQLEMTIHVSPLSQYIGAIGAALFALDRARGTTETVRVAVPTGGGHEGHATGGVH
jgi:predicted CoA-substrate-specific enzyme activase